jgi:hypothetical protein
VTNRNHFCTSSQLAFPGIAGDARRQNGLETERVLHERLPLRQAAAQRATQPIHMSRPGVTAMFASLHRWPPRTIVHTQNKCRRFASGRREKRGAATPIVFAIY